MYIDTHAHLSDERFNTDRREACARARGAGVTRILEVGCEIASWERTLALSRSEAGLSCILGIHPQSAKEANDLAFARLETLCRENPAVAAVGETGLDYHYEYSPRELQKAVFLRHIALAKTIVKPLVIHCRSAYPDLLALLEALPEKEFRGVIHCFSGNLNEAKALLAKGFLLGIDGPVTYPNATALREVVAAVPLEKLVLETDAPYLTPQTYRGKRNEPAYLPLIAAGIAKIKGVDIQTVASVTTASAEKLFNLTEKYD